MACSTSSFFRASASTLSRSDGVGDEGRSEDDMFVRVAKDQDTGKRFRTIPSSAGVGV